MKYPLTQEEQRKKFIEVIDYLMETGISQGKIAREIGRDSYELSKIRYGKKFPTSEMIESLHNEYNINPAYVIWGASNMFDAIGLKYEHFDSFVENWNVVKHKNKNYILFSINEDFCDFLVEVHETKEKFTKNNDTRQFNDAFKTTLEDRKVTAKKKEQDSEQKTTEKKYLKFSSEKDLYLFVLNVVNLLHNKSNSIEKDLNYAFSNALKSLKENYQDSKKTRDYVLVPTIDAEIIAQDYISANYALGELTDFWEFLGLRSKDKTD